MKKKNGRKVLVWSFLLLLVMVFAFAVSAETGGEAGSGEEYRSFLYATPWALVPPVVAIVLALITKEVYSSLFIGILTGALFYANFNLETAYVEMFNQGFIASLADSWNVGILIFLVVLGTIVVMMNRAGGSAAYGAWAVRKIKTRKGALLATTALGALIFVDDYFNCLTVGSVMRPVTDTHKISRAKLAYIIDATAAPICMIAPISSWAAAVAGVMEGDSSGLHLFVQAIPFNFYSLLTIAMMILLAVWNIDFGSMRIHEANAAKGDLYTTPERPYADVQEEKKSGKGKVYDLIIPIAILIVLCVVGMIYTGGFFQGTDFVTAFANCDASVGLSLGSSLALIVTIIYMLCRRVLSFKECMNAIPEGFKTMVPAILILTFAWTLSGMTGLLGADVFVSNLFETSAKGLTNFLPAIVFLVAIGLAFSTGTSWGTFGILLPILAEINFPGSLMVISVSACLAGSVCGDHCSPISDTTIMASTGAQCDHVNHVSTQLPYAMFVAGFSFIGYLIAGFVQVSYIVLPIILVLMAVTLLLMRRVLKNRESSTSAK